MMSQSRGGGWWGEDAELQAPMGGDSGTCWIGLSHGLLGTPAGQQQMHVMADVWAASRRVLPSPECRWPRVEGSGWGRHVTVLTRSPCLWLEGACAGSYLSHPLTGEASRGPSAPRPCPQKEDACEAPGQRAWPLETTPCSQVGVGDGRSRTVALQPPPQGHPFSCIL